VPVKAIYRIATSCFGIFRAQWRDEKMDRIENYIQFFRTRVRMLIVPPKDKIQNDWQSGQPSSKYAGALFFLSGFIENSRRV
jgi:hypothetical protein